MKRKWRYLAGLLMAGLFTAGGGTLRAAVSDSVQVTVRIQTLSVDIGETAFDFGALQYNQSAVSSVFNVTNSGNVTERYALKASVGPNWSLGNTNGDKRAVLYALFKGNAEGVPATSDFTMNTDTVSVANKTAGATDNTAYSDTASPGDGQNVATGAFRDLFLMILTPTTESTSAGATQTIYLTITAQP